MADLAKLVVRLEAQSAQLITELDKANGRIARFERNATGSLDKLNKRFDRFGFGVKSIIGGLFAAVSFGKVIKATDEAVANFANLENAVERAGAAAGGRSAKDFAAFSNELQKITTESDDAIQGVQQLLLRFQAIRTDRFDEATKRVLDLSIALRKDLGSSAELVGKALADPIKGVQALAKAGVIFSQSQKDTIKQLVETGKRAEAQGLILDQLEKRFGGAAEAARGNFSGALKGVQNALGDLLEADGGLPGATESLNSLAEVLQDPQIRAGADALFSTIIRGAAGAAEFIAKIAGGLSILFTGKGNNARVNLELQIEDLREEMADALEDLEDVEGALGELGRGATRASYQAQIDDLIRLTEEMDGIGQGGLIAAERLKFTGETIRKDLIPPTEEATIAAEELRKKLEEQGKALTDQLATPMEQYNARVAEADKLLGANAITLETWARALGAARGEISDFGKGMLEVSERFRTFDEELEDMLKAGKGDNEDAIQKQLDEDAEKTAKKFEEVIKQSEKAWSVFSDQAARNTQDILADGIFEGVTEGFDNGIKGMLDSFVEMLAKMAAQAIAADIAGKIFGIDEDGKPGGGGGWLDKILGGLGGGGGGAGIVAGENSWMDKILGGLGGLFGFMDQGGHGHAGEPVMIGRGAQPELFVPDTAGDFYPNASMGGKTEINFHIAAPDGRVSLETQQQVAARTQAALAQAQRRNS